VARRVHAGHNGAALNGSSGDTQSPLPSLSWRRVLVAR
jgi:hypothetical protein